MRSIMAVSLPYELRMRYLPKGYLSHFSEDKPSLNYLYHQDCISLGSGEPSSGDHCCFVLYHSNSPRWSETLKLPIPVDRFRGSHLRFEFRHCSSEYSLWRSGGLE
ncbi:hypothetical protein CRUP_035032, partial [Coryphaenoides rupestris]